MFLLDTNVLSELRRPRQPVKDWLVAQDHRTLFVSVMSLGEVEKGIRRVAASDEIFASRLRGWLDETTSLFRHNTLPVTLDIALAWGRIAAGRSRDTADALIAATAISHDLTLVTRNIRDFDDLPLKVFNPWTQ